MRELVHPVVTTLHCQGKIGPPRSIDLERAPEWKHRLAGDPFDELSPASAKVLREHMDILVPPWSEIIALTAQHGQALRPAIRGGAASGGAASHCPPGTGYFRSTATTGTTPTTTPLPLSHHTDRT